VKTLQSTFDEVQSTLETGADAALSENPLARSRLLRLAGGALFAWAVAAFLPDFALAHCATGSEHPCFGYDLCGGYPSTGCENREAYCCSDQNNTCHSNCNPGPNVNTGCDPGGDLNCWHTCHEGKWYKCCDCHNDINGNWCICRFQVGTC
jgi:hypothetical protein